MQGVHYKLSLNNIDIAVCRLHIVSKALVLYEGVDVEDPSDVDPVILLEGHTGVVDGDPKVGAGKACLD